MANAKTADKNTTSELTTALSEVLARFGRRHKLALSVASLNINSHGSVTARIKGDVDAADEKATAAGMTSGERRFKLFHTDAKLPAKALGLAYMLDGKRYELVGLRGQRNKVVLRDSTGDEFLVENVDFRREAKPTN